MGIFPRKSAMSMTVPNCSEWQAEPGFQTAPCHCVRVCGEPWPDCISCRGAGLIGIVSIGVHDVAMRKKEMPALVGDRRFDPRVGIYEGLLDQLAAFEADQRRSRKQLWIWSPIVIAALIGWVLFCVYGGLVK